MISGFVFFPLIAAIIALRVRGSTMSVNHAVLSRGVNSSWYGLETLDATCEVPSRAQ